MKTVELKKMPPEFMPCLGVVSIFKGGVGGVCSTNQIKFCLDLGWSLRGGADGEA